MRPLLVDTDPGVDDALALLLAWGSPEIRVEAITTVAGNVGVDQATANLIRLLTLRRPAPVPTIARGAAQPLRRALRTAHHYHGADGLGGVDGWAAVLEVPERPAAWELIATTARARAGDLTLVALGPLTNLALALDRGAGALGAVGRVVVMGGAVDVPGNVTPDAEFNVHVDPDAAARVLAAGLPLDLVPLDATHQAVLEQARLARAMAGRLEPLASRIAAFTDHAFRRGAGRMALHDPLAVAVAVDDTLVGWERARIEIGGDGETRRAAGPANCRLACSVDVERFLAMFLDRLAPGGPAR
jgi:inosine-uridine nucleoside N-ribohydrolase